MFWSVFAIICSGIPPPPQTETKIQLEKRLKENLLESKNGDSVIKMEIPGKDVEGFFGANVSSCVLYIVPDLDLKLYNEAYEKQKLKTTGSLTLCIDALNVVLQKRKIKLIKPKTIDPVRLKKSIQDGVPVSTSIRYSETHEIILARQEKREVCEKIEDWLEILKTEEKKSLDAIKKSKTKGSGGAVVLGYNAKSKEFLIASTHWKKNFWITEKELKLLCDEWYTIIFEL